MKVKKILLFLLLLQGVLFTSCLKNEEYSSQNVEEQLRKDDEVIKKYIEAKEINAVKHESGIYYEIINPGEGDKKYTANTIVKVEYSGQLLNGTVFDKTKDGEPIQFYLGQVIVGWQIGVQLIQKGGEIRIIVPSGYAYGSRAMNGIPANSVLDFTIKLIDVN